MKNKTYPTDVVDEVQAIGNALMEVFKASKTNLRAISRFSSMSVNSVKAVLAGNTANIASYSLVAKALGTDLITLIKSSQFQSVGSSTTTSVPTLSSVVASQAPSKDVAEGGSGEDDDSEVDAELLL